MNTAHFETESAPTDPVVEQFPNAQAPGGLKFQAFENPPVPRFWFVNPRGTR